MMTVEETGNLLHDENILSGDDFITMAIDESNHQQAWFICFCLAMGNAVDAIEIICVGYIITQMPDVSTFDQELLTAAVFIGMLLGGILCGYLSDLVGRRPTILICFGVNSIAGVASAFSPNVQVLTVLRVIGGLGIGGSVPIVFTVGAEVFPSKIRGKMLSVVATFWMVGALYVAVVGWIIFGDDITGHRITPGGTWQLFALVCAVPVVLTFFLTLAIVPESPRFLLHKGRYAEAARTLKSLCGPALPMIEAEICNSLRRQPSGHNSLHDNDGNAIQAQTQLQPSSQSQWTLCSLSQSPLCALFRPALLRTTAILASIWFALSFGSYGLSTWITKLFANIGLVNPYADSFIFALANLPGNVFSILFIERLGRKRLLAGGMCLAASSTLLFALDSLDPVVVVLSAALFNAFSVTGWNALDTMSVECFPTSVRSSAMGMLASAGRIGSISAQFVDGGLQKNVPVLLAVTTVCMTAGGLMALLLSDDHDGITRNSHDKIGNNSDTSFENFDQTKMSNETSNLGQNYQLSTESDNLKQPEVHNPILNNPGREL